MNVTILGASGAVGLALTRQALQRGHTVIALARTPARIDAPDSPRLIRVAADVRDPAGIAQALDGSEIVLSGLGVAKGDKPGVLTAGSRAVIEAHPGRIIWLGAYGTGPSAQAAGFATRTLLKAMGAELTDKVTADGAVLEAGGTVFHSGPFANGPESPTRRTVGLDETPKRFFPARISRETVAAAMLDEARTPRFPGRIAVPLGS
ncbi:NAD(P)-dependent oxidoreductase [Streptomyces sp. NPDC058464]|uniref:NAD(P)-dependent oxidoreductase n=1 Tax=Streptomyces sp. NPDC058464 TaxID=3346511 RepID=UPI00365157AC